MARRTLSAVNKMLLAFLLALCVAASNDLVPHEPTGPQDILSLVAPLDPLDNITFYEPPPPSEGAESTCGIQLSRRGLNPFAHLFKRDACATTSGGSTYDCQATAICCTVSGNSKSNWCCANTLGCGPGTSSTYCTFRISWSTVVQYVTSLSNVYSTAIVSVAGSTSWSTVVSTSILVVTRSDVATATDVTWVTITAKSNNARSVLTAVAAAKSISGASSTAFPTATLGANFAQSPLRPEITPAPRFQMRGLLRRQTMLTVTSTTTVISTIVRTILGSVTSQVLYTAHSTTTSVITSTFTSAINAKTTVSVTSTFTQQAGAPTPDDSASSSSGSGISITSSGGQAQPQQTGASGGSSGGSGLSKNAQIGIGAGVGSGSLIICLILAFFLYRRHRDKKEEAAKTINPTATAAAAAQTPPPVSDYKHPNVGGAAIPTYPMSYTSASPPPPSELYSDMTPGYHSGVPSPAPRYSSVPTSPVEYGHELSAMPMRQYQHPQQPRSAQAGSTYAASQRPAEMYHPVPVEIP